MSERHARDRTRACWRSRSAWERSRSTCRAPRGASCGATARRTTRWPGASRTTRDLRYDAARPRAHPHRVPERPAGPLPEARERRHHYRRRFRLPVAAARAARGGAALLRQGRSSTRCSRRRSSCRLRNARVSRWPTACCWHRRSGSSFAVLRRRGHAPGSALATAMALGLLTVVPLYLVWPTPEIFGFALVTAGLAAWAAGPAAALGAALRHRGLPEAAERADGGAARPRAAAAGGRRALARALFRTQAPGVAPARGRARASRPAVSTRSTPPSPASSTTRAASARPSTAAFHSTRRAPRFDDAGIWMTTNQVGPLVAGQDEEKVTAASGPARDAGEIRESLLLNLGYFWFGRFGGVLAYFFPALVALGLFLAVGPRDRVGWLCARRDRRCRGSPTSGSSRTTGTAAAERSATATSSESCRASCSWSRRGAGRGSRSPACCRGRLPGAGARVPDPSLARSRAPRARGALPGAAGRAHDAERPLDLHGSLAQEAAVRLHRRRREARGCRRLLPLLHGRRQLGQARSGAAGRASGCAALPPPRSWCAPSTSRRSSASCCGCAAGRAGDPWTARFDGRSARASVGPGEARELELAAGRGVRYYDTYLHVLRLESRRGAALPDGRVVGRLRGAAPRHGTARGRGGDAVSDRLARVVLGVVSGLVLLLAVATNLPQAADGRFWSDGAELSRDGGQPRLRSRPRCSPPRTWRA